MKLYKLILKNKTHISRLLSVGLLFWVMSETAGPTLTELPLITADVTASNLTIFVSHLMRIIATFCRLKSVGTRRFALA